MKNVLVNGAAGFIGFHLSYGLLENGYCVVGLDNLNEYYNISLRRDRLIHLEYKSGFTFQKLDLANRQAIAQLFEDEKFCTSDESFEILSFINRRMPANRNKIMPNDSLIFD